MKKTLYQILDVDPKASIEEIASAHKRLADVRDTEWPDANMPGLLQQAKEILTDPQRRAAYDRSLVPDRAADMSGGLVAESSFLDAWGKWIAAALVLAALTWWSTTRRESPSSQTQRTVAPLAASRSTTDAAPQPSLPASQPAAPAPLSNESSSVAPAAPSIPVAASRSAEDLFAELSPSVARVNVMDASGHVIGFGSGVVIDSGAVLTSCHVAVLGAKLAVKFGDLVLPAGVELADEALDLCRLRVPGMRSPAVPVRSVATVRTGERVYAIGSPQGLELTISEGIVSALRKVDEGVVIQTTAPISPGSSGGGLFDLSGHLIGIMTFQHRYGQNLNFALPADWIAQMRPRAASEASWRASAIGDRSQIATPMSLLIGRWLCRDWTTGRTSQYSFEADGRLGVAFNDTREAATLRYGVSGKTLQISDSKQSFSSVMEELTAQKLILHGRERSIACERQG